MTPEEKIQLDRLQRTLDQFLNVYYRIHFIDKDVFPNDVYFNRRVFLPQNITLKEGGTISLGSTTGTKIGATGDKIGFLGATPVLQQGAITTPSGGVTVDAESRTAIGQIKTALQNLGLTA